MGLPTSKAKAEFSRYEPVAGTVPDTTLRIYLVFNGGGVSVGLFKPGFSPAVVDPVLRKLFKKPCVNQVIGFWTQKTKALLSIFLIAGFADISWTETDAVSI